MGLLIRLYVNALLKGNPFVVIPTMVVAGVLGVAFLSEGLAQRDPVAIGVMAVIVLMFLTLIVVGVVDRKLNPKDKGRRPGPRR